MPIKNHRSILALFLIIVLCIDLLHVRPVLADGETPTEPPAPTEVVTEPPVESTPVPVESTPLPGESTPDPIEATATPLPEMLTQVPEGTEVVILDENGNSVPLATQEAADIVEVIDPMWCPVGVLPGGAGCSASYPNISDLIGNMVSNTGAYTQNGVIYFTASAGGSLALTDQGSSLGSGDFNTLNDFNLTLQGGWNGSTVSPTLSGQTSFGNNSITIGSSGNPWVGNIILNDFSFSSANQTAVTVYTTSGNITLSNVDVNNQQNNTNTALLTSASGNLTVQNGSLFDGNASQSQGFSATTGTGSITISDTIFSDSAEGSTSANTNNTADGATLNAPTVTLTNVTATGSDGHGITVNNANVVTLNNVTASGNGTDGSSTGFSGNLGSGVFVNGTVGSSVIINGGTFNNNQEYGLAVGNAANTTIYIQSTPTCTGNDSNAAGLGCYNDTTISDSTPPVISSTVTGTAGSNGWYTSNVVVSWTVTDAQSGILSSTGCTTSNLTSETTGTTLTCSATNNARLSNSVSVTIKIDKTAPSAALAITAGTPGSNGWYTSDVTVQTSGTDSISAPLTCTPNQFQTTDTTGVIFNGSCTNQAGLTTNASPLTVKLDKTGPTATLSVTAGTSGNNGWYTSDVTVHTSGTDSISGPVTCTADQFQAAETSGATFNGSCTNNAGLIGNATALNVKLDKTNPAITFSGRTAPNINGWNNTNVTVNWSCTDALSGPVSDPISQTVTTEGAGQSVAGTCTDNAGNTTSDTQGGINIDKTAPSLSLPGNITEEATSSAGAVVSYSSSVTDNLDGSVSVSCSPASGSTFPIGTTTVNCSSTDIADNTANGNFQITVGDTTAPVIAAHADEIVEATSASGAIVSYASPSTSDIVDGAGTASCSPASGGSFALGDTTVTCNATDLSGNSATPTTFVVHVVDTTAPVIVSHSDVTAEATSPAGAVVSYISPSTSDAVDGTGTATCSPASGAAFAFGDTTVTCNATDTNGNAATPTTFVVHVVDSTAPVIAFHPDETAEATSSSGAVVSYASPSTSDAIDGAGTATCSPASDTAFALGDTTVTCNATDSNGNSATPTTFVVHVIDTTAPVINSHPDETAQATSAAGAVVTYTSPSTSDVVDGAGTATCSPASGTAFAMGDTTVTCSATDSSGNSATPTTFVVHVVDSAAPIISSHFDETAEATSASGAVVTYTSPSTSDVVDGPGTATCSPTSGITFALGDTTVTCNATDSNGNVATPTTFVVHVVDTTAPIIASHLDETAEATSSTGAVVNYSNPSTSDIVDGAGTATCSPASGTAFALGDTLVTCDATNSSGNAATSTTFMVHVVDTTAPIIATHADVTVEATSSAGATASYTSPATSDAGDGAGTATCSPASGTAFAMGDTTVTCNATDSQGNVATATTFVVHVVDSAGPVIAAHLDVTAEATSSSGAIVSYTSPATSDAVDGAGIATCLPASAATFALGNTTVTCNASDSQGNAGAPTTFIVHVVDTTAPVIAAHLDVTVEAASSSGAVVNYTSPSTSDAVDGAGIATCSPASGTTFALGNTTVTCSAIDSQGNAATVTTFVIHIVDTTAPVIASHADETAEATSSAGAAVTYTNPSATDTVDSPIAVNCSPASGTTFAVGNTTVTCNAMDSSGNLATPTTFTVHILDTTAPVISLPANITANATGPSGAVVTFSASASDIVDGSVPVSCVPPSGSTFPLGPTMVNCSATDQHNNTSTASFFVNVQDPQAPIITLPANITAEATGPAGASVNFSASALDTVDGPVAVSCTPSSGTSFGFGTTTVSCSASDSSGNTNTAAFLVTVQDTTAPAIAPHSDFTTSTTDAAGVTVTYTSPATLDAVDGTGTASCLPVSGSLFPVGDTQIICSATDANGNSASRTFTLHVKLTSSSGGPVTPAGSPSAASPFIIPLTGGELIDLECNSILWAFGIKLSFLNLCDHQTTINSISSSDLPDDLPDGFSFVMGLDVDILSENQIISDLPDGSGIEMDFPIYNESIDDYAVLFWSDTDGDGNGEWVEIPEQLNDDTIPQTLSTDGGDELYHLTKTSSDQSLLDMFYQILTTDKTGIFILVKK